MSSKILHPETLAIRGEKAQSHFNEHNNAAFLTSSFMFDNAETGASLFLGQTNGFTYTRTANPTVSAFATRVAQLEQAEAGIATATGMAAIQAAFLTFLKAGDHLVTSHSLFGTTAGLINTLLPRIGVDVSFVSQTDAEEWLAACKPNTRMFFIETPSNPLNEVADIQRLADIAHQNHALLVVDNSFCSPAIQQPIVHGADISLQSATKAIDGHGRVMGGVLCGNRELINEVYLHVRTSGQVLSPFNAWVLLSGLETLFVRMEKQCHNARIVAKFLKQQPQVTHVYYTGLPEHPQYDLVQKQQHSGGIVVSFEIQGGQQSAWKIIDSVKLFSKTANLGDVKSTITHPWSTTHARMAAETKLSSGITEGLIRLSIGLEHSEDLCQDLQQALQQASMA